VHLFTQILPRPFIYPYPVINLLPQNEGYFATPCPFVYGAVASKKVVKKICSDNSSVIFVMLQKDGAEILCVDYKKYVVKKRSKYLREILSKKFRGNGMKRDKNVVFKDEDFNFVKDHEGICIDIVRAVNRYLTE
jgi:hypothetical protein